MGYRSQIITLKPPQEVLFWGISRSTVHREPGNLYRPSMCFGDVWSLRVPIFHQFEYSLPLSLPFLDPFRSERFPVPTMDQG